MIVYASKDDGTLYLESEVDFDPEYYTRYEIPDTVTLTAEQTCGHYGSIVEILVAAGQLIKS